jgi:hypothetical protein
VQGFPGEKRGRVAPFVGLGLRFGLRLIDALQALPLAQMIPITVRFTIIMTAFSSAAGCGEITR